MGPTVITTALSSAVLCPLAVVAVVVVIVVAGFSLTGHILHLLC